VIDVAMRNRKVQAINVKIEASGRADTAPLVLGMGAAQRSVDGAGDKLAEAASRDTSSVLGTIILLIVFQPRQVDLCHGKALVECLARGALPWCTEIRLVVPERRLRQHAVAVLG